MGVDFGGKRIGIALGESEHRVTSARPALEASGSLKKDAQAIATLAQKEAAEAIVVGLPLGGEDETAGMARIAGQLAERLRELGWVVYTVNEAMTTVEAEGNLRQSDRKASVRRRMRDGEAARLILERYFDEQEST